MARLNERWGCEQWNDPVASLQRSSVFATQRRPSQNKCQGQCEEFLSPVTYWSLSNRVLNRDPRLPAMPSLSGMLPFVLRTSNVHIMPFFFFSHLIAGTSSQREFLQTQTGWQWRQISASCEITPVRVSTLFVRYSKTHARFRSCLRVSERVLTQGWLDCLGP